MGCVLYLRRRTLTEPDVALATVVTYWPEESINVASEIDEAVGVAAEPCSEDEVTAWAL